jgi:hypothetical protein
LSDQNVKSSNGMFEHYLVAVAPNKDGDDWLNAVDGSKLAYSDSTKMLTYDGQQVIDHTYAVFIVQRGNRANIPSLLYNSNAPWAVLALGTFYQAPLPKISKKDDIAGVENQFIKNLGDCVGLLKRELRFSAFDRASAMYAFAARSAELVTAACKEGGLASNDCPTPRIDSYESGISGVFPLQSAESKEAAKLRSKSLNQQISAIAPQM